MEKNDKNIKKIVKGNVRTKKKNELQKFTDVFISEDLDNVKNYIFIDVLVPALKKAISDIVANGIDMLLYGDGNHSRKLSSTGSRVSYSSYYDNKPSNRNNDSRYYRSKNAIDCDDIIFESRMEAQDVLYKLDELISTYNLVTVADLYDLVGITAPFTANNYGWSDIRSAKIVPTRQGFLLKLPRPMPID